MRCIEDVTRRRPGWGSFSGPCDNPAEFTVHLPAADLTGERPLGACRHHLPVLVKRILTGRQRAPGQRVTIGLVIHEEAP